MSITSAMEAFLTEHPALDQETAIPDKIEMSDLIQMSAYVARTKGWWEPPPGRLTCKLLFQSELFEAC